MKSMLFMVAAGIVAFAATLSGQNTQPANPQPQGRGQGGAPYAWGDKNKDGICDFTGRPVGQNRGPGAGRGMRGRGAGRGPCNCCPRNQPPAANATPAR